MRHAWRHKLQRFRLEWPFCLFLFCDRAEKAISNTKEVILLGDFYCKLAKGSLNGNGKRLTSTFRSLGFCQLIKEATRITAQSATLLDLIATNKERFISKSGVLNACLSDHDLVYCIRKMNCKRSAGQTKSYRDYARYNSSAFCKPTRDRLGEANEFDFGYLENTDNMDTDNADTDT